MKSLSPSHIIHHGWIVLMPYQCSRIQKWSVSSRRFIYISLKLLSFLKLGSTVSNITYAFVGHRKETTGNDKCRSRKNI